MCSVQALKKGVRDIGANKSMVLLLWLTNATLALAVALPLFGWLQKMNHSGAAEAMLTGFSLPLVFDLLQYDFSTVVRILVTLVFWLALGAGLVHTFMSGGVLTVLANPGRQPFLEHFFATAGRYFVRFLGLLLVIGSCAGAIIVGLNAGLGALVMRLSEDAGELTPLLVVLGQGFVNLMVGAVFLLALHYARIETVVDGSFGITRTFLRSLVFVFKNILGVFALIIAFAIATGVVYLLYYLVVKPLPTTSWLLILALMAIQQVAMLACSALQVGLYGAEIQLFRLRRPTVAETAALGPSLPLFEATRQITPLAAGEDADGLARTDTD